MSVGLLEAAVTVSVWFWPEFPAAMPVRLRFWPPAFSLIDRLAIAASVGAEFGTA